MKPVPMKELAARIDAHLKGFEANPATNPRDEKYGTCPYYNAGCGYWGGAKVTVVYISYQGRSHLTRKEATTYLAWLDAGNVGKHWTALRERGAV